MPINPSALSASEPDPPATAGGESAAQEGQKRKRRTKAEMIAEAVVPADADLVDLKDANTGAKVQRPWREAVELVATGAAEFADKAMKYAVIKYDAEKVAGALDQGTAEPTADPAPGDVMEAAGEAKRGGGEVQDSIPPEAEVGDEVRVGAETLRVGHGGVLTSGPISVDGKTVPPKRTWQRELGTGGKGPWEVVQTHPVPDVVQAETNGHGSETPVETATLPAGVDIEQIAPGAWKIGTGVIEKIGLPDYSNLSIGPVTASRVALDDGRRATVMIGGREASIPAAVVEVAREATDIVEYILRYQRGELVSFLESTGALKQPVS